MSRTSLRNKWIEIIYKTATGSRKVRIILTPVTGFLFYTFIGLFIVGFIQIDKFLKLPKLFSPPAYILVSIPVLTIGAFLCVWSLLHFVKVRGTPSPFNPPPELVTTGPYGYVRNPMITGIFLLLFGLGILLRSVSLVFVFTPLFIILNVVELKAIEEPELERRLGKRYVEYKGKVPMFIPKLKMKTKR